jgi:uncharacterized membrane protein YphA (DoxX/SURF4 family)
MKKYLHYIPNAIIIILFIFMGAFGKLTGAAQSIDMFSTINLLDLPEYYARYTVGISQLFVAIALVFKKSEKIASFVGMIIMLSALYFHYTIFGMETSAFAFLGLFANAWIFFRK